MFMKTKQKDLNLAQIILSIIVPLDLFWLVVCIHMQKTHRTTKSMYLYFWGSFITFQNK